MKTYTGYRLGGRLCVVVNEPNGNEYPLHHLMLHSDGFEAGYLGSGPGDLALAILADHLNEKPDYYELREGYFRFPDSELLDTTVSDLAEGVSDIYERHRIKSLRYHQYFKADVIARLPQHDRWTLAEERVAEWIENFNKRSVT